MNSFFTSAFHLSKPFEHKLNLQFIENRGKPETNKTIYQRINSTKAIIMVFKENDWLFKHSSYSLLSNWIAL